MGWGTANLRAVNLPTDYIWAPRYSRLNERGRKHIHVQRTKENMDEWLKMFTYGMTCLITWIGSVPWTYMHCTMEPFLIRHHINTKIVTNGVRIGLVFVIQDVATATRLAPDTQCIKGRAYFSNNKRFIYWLIQRLIDPHSKYPFYDIDIPSEQW